MPTRAPAPKLADLSPMLLTEQKSVPRGGGWHFEIKYDGYRMLATTGQVEPRSIGLSSHVCKTYLRDTFLFTYGDDSGIKSWYDLKLAVEGGEADRICTIDDGSCADCSSAVRQYIGDDSQGLCQGGYGREEAFASLVNGTCEVVYGSAPPFSMLSEPINWFPSPVSQVYGSYFRRPPDIKDTSSAAQLMAKNVDFAMSVASSLMFVFITCILL